jgi:lipoxygenase homology domain-containing protein 1
VQVQTDGSGIGPDWKLDSVTVEHTNTGEAVICVFQGWISRTAGLRHTLHPQSGSTATKEQATVTYEVATFTSDTRFAGTDAEVWVGLNGDRGALSAQKLHSKTHENLFEQGKQNIFELVGPNIGKIKQVRFVDPLHRPVCSLFLCTFWSGWCLGSFEPRWNLDTVHLGSTNFTVC